MNAEGSSHLSTFALDVFFASGQRSDANVEKHVASCARCQAYLRDLDGLRAGAPSRGAEASSAKGIPWRQSAAARTMGRVVVPAIGSVALAAGLLAVVGGGSRSVRDDVGAKGTPGVQVLVRRAGATRIWDGRSPVRAGDAIALRVACDGLPHVAVASPEGDAWRRLSDVACPEPDDLLPFTLVADDHPGDERLALVLSRRGLDDASLRQALEQAPQTRDVWVIKLALPKETDR